MIMSFTFLSFAYLLKQHLHMELFKTTVVEGLFIGGWLFLWEAFSLFFFSSQEIRAKLKRYYRFIDGKISFHYE